MKTCKYQKNIMYSYAYEYINRQRMYKKSGW